MTSGRSMSPCGGRRSARSTRTISSSRASMSTDRAADWRPPMRQTTTFAGATTCPTACSPKPTPPTRFEPAAAGRIPARADFGSGLQDFHHAPAVTIPTSAAAWTGEDLDATGVQKGLHLSRQRLPGLHLQDQQPVYAPRRGFVGGLFPWRTGSCPACCPARSPRWRATRGELLCTSSTPASRARSQPSTSRSIFTSSISTTTRSSIPTPARSSGSRPRLGYGILMGQTRHSALARVYVRM